MTTDDWSKLPRIQLVRVECSSLLHVRLLRTYLTAAFVTARLAWSVLQPAASSLNFHRYYCDRYHRCGKIRIRMNDRFRMNSIPSILNQPRKYVVFGTEKGRFVTKHWPLHCFVIILTFASLASVVIELYFSRKVRMMYETLFAGRIRL